MVNAKLSNNTNNYIVHAFEMIQYSNHTTKFGIQISFERNSGGTKTILINYHLICGMLVLLASINFLFDPKDTNRSCMLVALLLVLATIFSMAQVSNYSWIIHKKSYDYLFISLLYDFLGWCHRFHCFDNLHIDLYDIPCYSNVISWSNLIHFEKDQEDRRYKDGTKWQWRCITLKFNHQIGSIDICHVWNQFCHI